MNCAKKIKKNKKNNPGNTLPGLKSEYSVVTAILEITQDALCIVAV